MFGGYEWVVTDNYDAGNEAHVSLKEGIEVGNGLPTLATPAIIKANLEEAGFEVRSRVASQETIDTNVLTGRNMGGVNSSNMGLGYRPHGQEVGCDTVD